MLGLRARTASFTQAEWHCAAVSKQCRSQSSSGSCWEIFLKLLLFFSSICKVFQFRIFKSKCKKNQQNFSLLFVRKFYYWHTLILYKKKMLPGSVWTALPHPLTWHNSQSSSKGGNPLWPFFGDNSNGAKGYWNMGHYAMFSCQYYISRRFGDTGWKQSGFSCRTSCFYSHSVIAHTWINMIWCILHYEASILNHMLK